jgi:hypothetical protein
MCGGPERPSGFARVLANRSTSACASAPVARRPTRPRGLEVRPLRNLLQLTKNPSCSCGLPDGQRIAPYYERLWRGVNRGLLVYRYGFQMEVRP